MPRACSTSMLTPETIDATARASFEMHRVRARYRPLDASVRKAPLDEAYRIQDALHRLMIGAGRGEIAGWKIALTSKAMQQMTGVDQPAAGAILLEGRASLARPARRRRLSPPGRGVRGGRTPRRKSSRERWAGDPSLGGRPGRPVPARPRACHGPQRRLQGAPA